MIPGKRSGRGGGGFGRLWEGLVRFAVGLVDFGCTLKVLRGFGRFCQVQEGFGVGFGSFSACAW